MCQHWDTSVCITKTCLYNFDPLKPYFCVVKLGFTGVYIVFLISTQKHRLRVFVTSTHNLCFEQKYEKISEFFIWKFSFFGVKFSVYLNRRVFVMPVNYNILLYKWRCLLRSTTFARHQKKEKEGTKKDKTNATYETPYPQKKANCNSKFLISQFLNYATMELVWYHCWDCSMPLW